MLTDLNALNQHPLRYRPLALRTGAPEATTPLCERSHSQAATRPALAGIALPDHGVDGSGSGGEIAQTSDSPVSTFESTSRWFGTSLVKRAVDLTFAVLLAVVFTPCWLLLPLLIRIKLGRPVLFWQSRPGLDGVPFRMVKFRTMTDERGADGELLPDSQRLTRFGRFLRSSSLDELPELWNVLKGEMSLIGPRPLLMEYLPLYSPEQSRRHSVRPGITGWAQINGRNAIGWEQKLRLDVWYVDHCSPWLDAKILVGTVRKVLRRADISAPGEATMPKFTGSEQARS